MKYKLYTGEASNSEHFASFKLVGDAVLAIQHLYMNNAGYTIRLSRKLSDIVWCVSVDKDIKSKSDYLEACVLIEERAAAAMDLAVEGAQGEMA